MLIKFEADGKEVAMEMSEESTKAIMKAYEETQKKDSGWERFEKDKKYFVIQGTGNIGEFIEHKDIADNMYYNTANYFSIKEKAEQVNTEQTLYRKMKKFSDENGGDEIDWKNFKQFKYSIVYSHEYKQFDASLNMEVQKLNTVYFKSRAIAKQAIELFGDEMKQVLGVE